MQKKKAKKERKKNKFENPQNIQSRIFSPLAVQKKKKKQEIIVMLFFLMK